MFNVGTGELLVILLVALIVLGPEKLPDAARKMGNIVAELRRMSGGFQEEMRSAMEDFTRPPLEPVNDDSEHPDAAHPGTMHPETTPDATPDDSAA